MVQCEVGNCAESLPCGLHWSLGRTDGPLVVGVVSLGALFSNQRSRCGRDVEHPVQLDVPQNFGFAHLQQ